jgi:hypothetical protein
MVDGAIGVFRPVKVGPKDYALLEYDVSNEELDRFITKVNRELDDDEKAGRLKPF